MGAIPQQIAESEKHNLFPLFGVELYVNPMQPKVANRAESAEFRKSLGDGSTADRVVLDGTKASILQKKFDKSCHLLAIAYSDQGYSNLVKLTSWAWIHGYYRKPRVNHEVLMKYKEGIIFTSTCANSEIARAFFVGGDENGFAMVEKYMAMFGEYFYLELMMLDFKDQKPYDSFLIRAHDRYHIPLILSQDCFVEGTLVLTNVGFKRIEEVKIGDKVLTHKNRWKPVELLWSRPLRSNEKIYRVSTKAGTFAYEATGNHEVYVGIYKNNNWVFDWIRTDKLKPKEHHLVVPKIKESDVFSDNDLCELDVLHFLTREDFQEGTDYKSSKKGNMGCRLQFNRDTQEFWSYRGWDRKCKTTVPRMIKIDDDFLKMLGWYIAEGWSEKNSNQVGFAFHIEEKHVADWLISYFSNFGILAKIYKVSKKGIAIRFSSVVFNCILGKMCGFGSNNKHLPRPNNKTWLKVWSKRQLSIIIREFWRGDGSNAANNDGIVFASTSKILIHEISCVFNSCGIFSLPCEELTRKKTWADKSYLSFTGVRGEQAVLFLMNKNYEPCLHQSAFDFKNYYLVPVKKVIDKPHKEQNVYCFQVKDDHSFAANLYAVSNCHYCRKEQSHNQRLMLMQQNKRTLAEVQTMIDSGEADDLFELQDTNLWLKSEDELNQMWELKFNDTIDYELYKQSKANTVKIAEFAKGVQINREIKLPKIPDADAVLWEEIKKGYMKRGCPRTSQYAKRIKEEYDLITEKGFASYFLIQKMMVDEARTKGPEILGFGDGSEAVGPGRGSVAGSLVAYCLRLHDVEPIIHDLRFSRFLSPARGGKQMKIRHTIQPISHESVDL